MSTKEEVIRGRGLRTTRLHRRIRSRVRKPSSPPSPPPRRRLCLPLIIVFGDGSGGSRWRWGRNVYGYTTGNILEVTVAVAALEA